MMVRKFKFFDGIIDNTYVISTTPLCEFTILWNNSIRDYYRDITIRDDVPTLYSSNPLSITDDFIENLINTI